MSDDVERLKAERNQIVAEIRRLQDSIRSEVERDLDALYERDPSKFGARTGGGGVRHLPGGRGGLWHLRELRAKDRPCSAEGHTPGHVMSQVQNGTREEEAVLTFALLPGYPRG